MRVAVKNSKTEVDCLNYRPVSKGALVGFFTLVEYSPDYPLGRKTSDCCLFTKADRSWITFPSRPGKTESPDGKTVYFPYVAFPDKTFQNNLSSAAVEALQDERPKPQLKVPSDAIQDSASFDW